VPNIYVKGRPVQELFSGHTDTRTDRSTWTTTKVVRNELQMEQVLLMTVLGPWKFTCQFVVGPVQSRYFRLSATSSGRTFRRERRGAVDKRLVSGRGRRRRLGT